MRRGFVSVLTIAGALGIDAGTLASQPARDRHSPDALARAVVAHFLAGDTAAFDRVYPLASGRSFARGEGTRVAGIARVAAILGDRAVLVLGAARRSATPGSETLAAAALSGFYLAERRDDGWAIDRRIPLDSGNAIHRQRLHVAVEPGIGIRVVDTLTLRVGAAHGLGLRLHPRARVTQVRLDGSDVPHAIGGGLVWVDARPTKRERSLVLAYELDVAPDSADGEAGRFLPAWGHLRHYYYWHPFFDLGSTNDLARFTVHATIPARFALTTSVPQSVRTVGGRRVVTGTSARPTNGITIAYSSEWRPVTLAGAGFRAEAFIGSGSEPESGTGLRVPADSFVAAIGRAHALLTARYGPPGGAATAYYAVAHLRSLPPTQAFRNNDLIAMGAAGMPHAPTRAPQTAAVLAHETSHAWTRPTGAAEAWLMEGWAAYAESEILRAELGAEEERAYWERMRAMHYRTGAEGKWPIMGDDARRIVSYRKGPWVWRALRHAVGDSAFVRGMRRYVALPPGAPAGLDELARFMSEAAGRDVLPLLLPWLTARSLPDVAARIDGTRVVLSHAGPVVPLPRLGVELRTESGVVRRTVDLDSIAVVDVGEPVAAVRVDPDHDYLLRRRWGDTVRLALPSSVVPNATKVAIVGDLRVGQRLPARRIGDEWVVEVAVPEGQYDWFWLADGKGVPGRSGTTTVEPRMELERANP